MTSSFSQCEFYIGVMVISIKIKAFHPISFLIFGYGSWFKGALLAEHLLCKHSKRMVFP